jgi:hypothetical protein
MHNTVATASALKQQATDLVVAAALNRILEKPPVRAEGRYAEYRGGTGNRPAHATGLRRHDGAGGRHRGDLHRQSARMAHILAAAS